MKYLLQDEQFTWLLDPYLAYIAGVSQDWPDDLRDLASLPRLDLRSQGSLHDSWLQSCSIDLGDLRQERSETSIEIVLLGPYHDRLFRLCYRGVVSYQLDPPVPCNDLLVHELRRENDLWVHEMLFASGSIACLQCQAIEFGETLTAK